MNSQGKGWIVAASMGIVEALKDQGVCRWNQALRSTHRQAKGSFGSISIAQRLPAIDGRSEMSEKAKKAEESLRTVMYLSCWGPN